MLHLYLINARLRCFERDTYRAWQQQLIDHFFFDAEQKMHLDHEITSSGLRQRYLKDLFVQWRGLLLAYDEGLVAGDAILASAVWRNLCKGVPDTDPRALLAVVGWMRCSLTELEAISDANFPQGVTQILATPVWSFWTQVEDTFRGGPGRHLGLNQRLPGNEASQTATTEAAQKAAAVEAAIRAARRVAQR
ncbi:hypothetical protein CDD82_1474 [Ophiocordyceps australis]|uniref:Ubiquinol-cytochrome c chaperone domain-containing protein n=1 Tax=Ophiocordyceps australis TaxID=1399860 RepID=A0A2C5YI45_9HYPO|nr:hypothetical protein CDD82_1474 [Ophiocordyceps australis]